MDNLYGIPKAVVVFNAVYTVELVSNDDERLPDNSIGLCMPVEKRILVVTEIDDMPVNAQTIKETFYHELAHAYMEQTGRMQDDTEENAEHLAMFAKFVVNLIGTEG